VAIGSETGRASHVFISYAREDGSDYAERLARTLAQRGYPAWWDQRNLNPSLDFSGEIEGAIKRASRVLVCLSPSLIARRDSFVNREVLYAEARRKPIVALRFPGVDRADVPLLFVHLTWIPFVDTHEPASLNFASGFERLLAYLSTEAEPADRVPSGDPFQDYLETLYGDLAAYLDSTVYSLISLTAQATKRSRGRASPPALPISFLSSALTVKTPSLTGVASKRFETFAESFAHSNGRALLVGEAGAGKTTTIIAFAREAVANRLEDPSQPLPVMARVADWKSATESQSLEQWLAALLSIEPASLQREASLGRVLLLLDGLDELSSPALKTAFLKAVAQCPATNRLVITSRPSNLDAVGADLRLDGEVTLDPLTDEQIDEYLRAQPALARAVATDARLKNIARTPLLLSILFYAFADTGGQVDALHDRSAVQARDSVFETFVRRRFEHESLKTAGKPAFSLSEIYKVLGHAAFQNAPMTFKTVYAVPEIPVSETIEKRLPDASVPFIEQVRELRFLIVDEHERLMFIHDLLREHFLRSHVLDSSFGAAELDDFITSLRAVSALREDDDDPRALELLIRLLSSPDAEVLGPATERAGKRSNDRLIQALTSLLGARVEWHDFDFHSGGYPVHQGACRALKEIGEPAVERLIDALSSPDPLTRENAARVLGDIGDRRAVTGLIALLGDSDKNVLKGVVNALGRMPDARAIRGVGELLRSERLADSGKAVEILAAVGNAEAIQALVGTLTRPGRNFAAVALGTLRVTSAIPNLRAAWLARLLRDEIGRKALADIDTSEAQTVLAECEAMMSIPPPDSSEEKSWVQRVEVDKIADLDTSRLHLYLRICEDYLKRDAGRYEWEIRRRLWIGGVELYRRELEAYSRRSQNVE
jgi:HEAT repeat protein